MEKVNLSRNPLHEGDFEAEQAVTNITNWLLNTYRVPCSNPFYVEVELKINGVEVSYLEMVSAFAHYDSERVKAKALEMLSGDEALAGIRQALAQARIRIRDALDNVKGEPMKG